MQWTGAIYVSVSSDILAKTSGGNGCSNADAYSSQEINSGSGYLEITKGTDGVAVGLADK